MCLRTAAYLTHFHLLGRLLLSQACLYMTHIKQQNRFGSIGFGPSVHTNEAYYVDTADTAESHTYMQPLTIIFKYHTFIRCTIILDAKINTQVLLAVQG